MIIGFCIMKQIKLTQGKFTLVDDEDFEELNQFNWYANKKLNTFYAVRNEYNKGKHKTLFMHRVVLRLTNSNIKCDHINHNGLDNQKSNLRTCTHSQNQRNSRNRIGTTSKYKGVHFCKQANKWRVFIMGNKKQIHIGYFKNEIEAAKKYDEFAILHFGEFANLNFK